MLRPCWLISVINGGAGIAVLDKIIEIDGSETIREICYVKKCMEIFEHRLSIFEIRHRLSSHVSLIVSHAHS